jgi:hypothetical protein
MQARRTTRPGRGRRGLLLAAAIAGTGLLGWLGMRTWTWQSPHPVSISAKVADHWPAEAPAIEAEPGVWNWPLPRLERRLNGPAFLRRVREAMRSHPVAEHWTDANMRLEPALLSPRGPLIVRCELPGYGVRRWSLLRQGFGVDRRRNERLEADLKAFLTRSLGQPNAEPAAPQLEAERAMRP